MTYKTRRRFIPFFNDLKIGVKILVGYIVALALAAVVGGLSIVQLDQVNATVTRLTGHLAQERALAESTAVQIHRIRLYANQYILGEQTQTDLDLYNQAITDAQTVLDDADQIITEPDRIELQAQIRTNFNNFTSAFAEIVQLLATRRTTIYAVLDPEGARSVENLAVLRNNGFEVLDFTSAQYASEARDTFAQMQVGVIKYLATGDEQFANQVNVDYATIRATFDLLQVSVRDTSSRTLLADVITSATAYHQGFQNVRGGVARQHVLIATQLDVYGPEVDRIATTITTNINSEFAGQGHQTNAVVAQTRLVVLVTLGLAVVLGLAFGAGLSRTITRPIEQLARAAQGIAEGALDQEVHVPSHDELGILAGAFNHMSAAVRTSIKSVQANERRYRTLFDSAPDAIFVVDIYTDEILDVNPATYTLYGYSRDELLHMKMADITPGGPDPSRGQKSGVIHIPLRYHTKKDGTLFPVEVTLSHLIHDKVTFDVGFNRDITERNRAEDELQKYREHLEDLVETRTAELAIAKERAESADRLTSAFLASMSHELRTPLNSIIGFTGIILQGLVGPLNDEQSKQIGMLHSSANHLLSLINDVLDISKIEAGQLQITRAPFDMRATIEKVIHALIPMAENKGLSLSAEIAPEVSTIVSDRRRIEQILINLINNAIKFTEQGQVRIERLVY